MEPPPPSLSSTVVVTAATSSTSPPHVPPSNLESLNSTPKSRTTDAWDDLPPPASGASSKLRLMCSYNGHILPRPHDKSLLCYMGGDTRIVVVDRNSSLSSLLSRLSTTLLNGHRSFTLKYQLPNEDLDSLISVTTDEDLDNMIEEYDRTMGSSKPSRLRLFLFTAKPEATGQIIESSAKSDDWFLDALNRGFSDSDSTVNRLLGLDDTLALGSKNESSVIDDDSKQQPPPPPPPPPQQQGGQDVQNLPDSPLLDTSSSFGSTSSSPSLANLPPIRVHVEEAGGDQRLGIEEQLARFNVGNEGFAAISSSPPPMPVTISLPAAPANATTVFSDDDRPDDHRRKPPTHQVKSNSGGHEMPSPDSVSSDSSMNNPVFHQRPLYQEPLSQMPSGSTVVTGLINPSDPNTLLSHNQNQNQDSGYIFHPAQSQPQQQQFIHAPQYLHHHPSTGHPVQSYIQVYPSQQPQQQSFHRHPGQLDNQPYHFYYATAPVPPKPYNTPVTQSVSVTDSLPMMAPPPNSHLRNTPGGKPEAGVYATTPMMGGAQIVHQVPMNQQQFMGYSQTHHPPQSVSAGIPNYGYEAPKQVYYTQNMGHAQYQTMTGPPPGMVLPDGSAAAKLPAENMTQQIRSSQPL